MRRRAVAGVALFVWANACSSGTEHALSRRPLAEPPSPADAAPPAFPSAEAGAPGSLIAGPSDGAVAGNDPATEDGATCAAASQKVETTPLDIFVMMDQSKSMDEEVAGGGMKWSLVTAALSSFVNDPKSAGMGIGIQYFPIADGMDQDGIIASCNVADYAAPDVAITELPGGASAIVQSLEAHEPNGGTPTVPALNGALSYAREWAGLHKTHKVIVVLATDGDPNDCDSTAPAVAAVAKDGAAGSPAIPTYVIGVGALLTNLNQVAEAGGTGQAFVIDTTHDVEASFLSAMNTIRNAASLPCKYAIPPATPGRPIDLGKVNVAYTAGSGASKGHQTTILHAADPAHCDPTSGGWFYDDANNPTAIELCDASCGAVMSDASAEVDVLIGCQTLVVPVR